jgi:hypothetical protein
MTAQIQDVVMLRKTAYDLSGISGEGLFDPERHSLKPVSTNTACWRGYHATYLIEADRLWLREISIGLPREVVAAIRLGDGGKLFAQSPRHDDLWDEWIYDDLHEPVNFSGGILLGHGLITRLHVNMGFAPAWKYSEVSELIFESGALVSETDRSADMEELRALKQSEPLRPDTRDKSEVEAWIARCFSRDYSRMKSK